VRTSGRPPDLPRDRDVTERSLRVIASALGVSVGAVAGRAAMVVVRAALEEAGLLSER
jgi:hypothetical protein